MNDDQKENLTIICIGVMAIGLLLVVLSLVGCEDAEQRAQRMALTTDSARRFAQGFEGVRGVECSPRDSDHDGYVTCTVFLENNDFRNIECTTDGCKMKEDKQQIQVDERSIKTIL